MGENGGGGASLGRSESPSGRRSDRGDGLQRALAALASVQDGVVTRSQALQCLSEGAVRHRIASGRWQRVHRGILVTHSGPIAESQQRWIAVFAGGNGRMAPLASLSALERSGFRGYPSYSIHILMPQHIRASKPPPGVVIHRTASMPRRDYLSGFPPRTAPARSVVDAAQWASSPDRARAIVAAAFQQRLVTLPEIEEVLARFTTIPRHRLITETACDAAGGSESISEIEFLHLCCKGNLPPPARQTVVIDGTGRRRYRDADFEEWRVHVEIDGGQHTDPAAWWADMERQNEMCSPGEQILRFPAWAVRNAPDRVIARVRRTLREAGWCPPT